MLSIRNSSLAILAAALVSCSAPRTDAERSERLARRIEGILNRPELRSATVGIEIRRVRDGGLLYQRGAERLLAPASTTKLVSCFGALLALGKDFRFRTEVVPTGEVRDGVLRGNLVLVASGDPNLSQRLGPRGELRFEDSDHTYAGFVWDARAVPGDPLAVLASLAEQVKASGVERVEGAAIVDDGIFQEREDEFVGPFSAACVNDGVIDILVTPGAADGAPAAISVTPSHPEIAVENQASTAAAAAEPTLAVEAADGWGRFRLTGTIPLASPPVLAVGRFADPGLAAAHLFAGELRKRGISLRDPPRRAAEGPRAYAGSPRVAAHTSPPLAEAVRVILKVSHNLHATMLPVIVGAVCGGAGNRFEGYRKIRELLVSRGVGADEVVLRSGSGGGRADSLSARFLVSLLLAMARSEPMPELQAALPLGGKDGTLARHFQDPIFANRVRAKTGTLVDQGALSSAWIYRSKALAGYLELGANPAASRRPGNDTLAFAILINGAISPTRREGSDALFRAQEDILRAAIELYAQTSGRVP